MRSTYAVYLVLIGLMHSCATPPLAQKEVRQKIPARYYLSERSSGPDTTNTALLSWKEFFTDGTLIALIDTALKNNRELAIFTQEVYIAQNEVRFRTGSYLPFLYAVVGSSLEKPARYTLNGAVEENLTIEQRKIPDPLSDYTLGASFTWEIDIWKKLRNSKKAALYKYLATVEGRTFMTTRLIAEIAHLYYELVAIDNQLDLTQKNLDILNNILQIVKQEKNAARTTELAVKRFEAEVLKNKSRVYTLQQSRIEIENQLNFLAGRFSQPIPRKSQDFLWQTLPQVAYGVPSELIRNRPDIRKAEKELQAANLETRAAHAEFFPSLTLNGIAAYKSFSPSLILRTPESLLLTLAGDLITPLVNRNALKANYFSAIARQNQAAYEYEQKVLQAYQEVSSQLTRLVNLQQIYDLKKQQVETLKQSIEIAVNLFRNARADYMEVLFTQREALEAEYELVEIKKLQMQATINLYRAIGGGQR
ncbi:MAG: TolC family protein [Bacteroidia bacterium]